MSEITDTNRWQLLQSRVFEKRIVEAVVFLRRNKIEPILIKGWAIAQSYPEPRQRHFNDIDLMVAPEIYADACRCLENFSKKNPIDLHPGAKNLDTLSFENLYAHSKLVKCGDTLIRVLCPEDHLRVLCVHWLMDGGANRRRLQDIFYAVQNRPANFDWDRCLNVVSATRKKWIICVIGLAHKYAGLNLENTPLARYDVNEIPRWIIETVEREWENPVPLIPLHQSLSSGKLFVRQILKRFPPNPIQATVDMEGEFDNRKRVVYQIGDVFLRLGPSLIRLRNGIFSKAAFYKKVKVRNSK